jgi:hypothetical protein
MDPGGWSNVPLAALEPLPVPVPGMPVAWHQPVRSLDAPRAGPLAELGPLQAQHFDLNLTATASGNGTMEVLLELGTAAPQGLFLLSFFLPALGL